MSAHVILSTTELSFRVEKCAPSHFKSSNIWRAQRHRPIPWHRWGTCRNPLYVIASRHIFFSILAHSCLTGLSNLPLPTSNWPLIWPPFRNLTSPLAQKPSFMPNYFRQRSCWLQSVPYVTLWNLIAGYWAVSQLNRFRDINFCKTQMGKVFCGVETELAFNVIPINRIP